ncbi:hypothetical protein JST97_19645 [bacterium]|nr:hypothetical protein [bacterium]
MPRTSLLAATLVLAWLAGGCVSPTPPGATPTNQSTFEPPESTDGLRFKLSPAPPTAHQADVPVASPSPLSPSEIQPLLDALPRRDGSNPDQPAIQRRPSSQKPPRQARSLPQSFPPPGDPPGPPAVAQGPLEVLSCTPQGSVEMASQLQITFNQPMLALGEASQAEIPPLKLTPRPPGGWRWLGTQTLIFQPQGRFPMATRFELEVPSGISASGGARLQESKRFSFQTPTLELVQSSPQGEGQSLQPLLFLQFNQDIQADKIAPMLKLLSNSEEVPLRRASREQILKDEEIQARVEQAGEKRSLVMLPGQKLKPGQAYSVELPAGLPSAEGPLGTEKSQSFSFSTFDPLKLKQSELEVEPGREVVLSFNNSLDAEKFEQKWVRVRPEVPELKVSVDDRGLSLQGRFKGHTDYEVSLAPGLTDEFGQKLAQAEKVNIRVGAAPPTFTGPTSNFITLDPKGPPGLDFEVTNYPGLRVRAWKVAPPHWDDFVKFLTDSDRLTAPGKLVFEEQISTGIQTDQPRSVRLDLKPIFPNGLGQAVVVVEPQLESKDKKPAFVAWVQATHLGLDVCADDDQLVAWVSHLDSGAAWPGAGVQLLGSQSQARSGEDGLAILHPETSGTLLVARQGDDLAILPKNFNGWNSGAWNFHRRGDTSLWHVLDDRSLYRPGESVHVKGWLRKQLRGPSGQLAAASPGPIHYHLQDAEGKKLAEGQLRSGGLGGFSLELKLPREMALGKCQLRLTDSGGSTYQHPFQVQEYRRPEFEVSAQAQPGVCQVGQSALLSAQASYFSGGALANSKVDWRVSSSPASFSPPGWEEYSFGSWSPWWDFSGPYGPRRSEARQNSSEQSSSTDSKGCSRLQVDFLSVDPPRPHSLEAEATVEDLNHQSWTARTSVLVHPASIYVGLKSQTTFVEKGQPLRVSVLVADLEGKAVSGRPVQLRFYRQEWDEKGQSRALDLQERQLTSVNGPQNVDLPTHEAGAYVVEARVQDEQNRSNASDLSLWVSGLKLQPSGEVAQQKLNLIPNKRQYRPGETAEVLVQAPFSPAELLVTTRRDGLARVERLSAAQGSATVKIPLNELDLPGLELQVDALGRDIGPAYASGSLFLEMSRASRQLKVAIKPGRSALQPGQSTQVEVQLTDQQDQPVSGSVTLLAVDEAVLALTGYDPADPLDSFCVRRQPGVEDEHSRDFLNLNSSSGFAPGSVPEINYNAMVGLTAGRDDAQPPPAPPPPPPGFKLRSNFNPLAAFQPDVATDASGKAKITVTLPDSLTRYRLIALAESGIQRFGKGESSLTARKPLQIRPSTPRFANYGDRFKLPVLVQNQTDESMQVDLVARAFNLELEQAGYRLQLKPQERVEVSFACAARQAGPARVQWAANAVSGNDAAEISLPVQAAASRQQLATYGVLDQGAVRQSLLRPAQARPESGQLRLTTSSTALAELTDSYQYLQSYPYECSEQLASRALATASLGEMGKAFQTSAQDSPETIQRRLDTDLEHLAGLQNDDGGFDAWERGKASDPFVSVHVAHMLVRLKQKGYTRTQALWEKSRPYLKEIQSHLRQTDYGPDCSRSVRAYALYVQHLAGQPDRSGAQALLQECPLTQLGPEVAAWLLPTLAKDPAEADRVLKYLENHSNQTAATAEFSFNYGDKDHLILYSDRRDDALILESLVRVRPQHPLVPKLVSGLLSQRRQGRWENTQENCWVLLALEAYFQHFERNTPNFQAAVWLGERLVGQQSFKGRPRQPEQLEVPLKELSEKADLVLSKRGPGRLYYRLGLSFSPPELMLKAVDNGFAVERSYQATEDNRDVSRDAEGVWHMRAGSLVRVQINMQTSARRYHVALVDPLPAGLEALNPELLGSQTEPAPANRLDGWWSSYWFEHQNLRDQRVEAFTSLLQEGVYHYSYLARATTLGEFMAPPVHAEEMYHPETFGRGPSEKVVIE